MGDNDTNNESGIRMDVSSGALSVSGDVAGRDVKKDSDIGRVADAMANQSKTQSEIMKMMSNAFIEAKREATEAQKQIAETTKNCNELLREQSDRHNEEIDRILNTTRNQIKELDDRIKTHKKEIDDTYQAITDSNQIIDEQRQEINQKEKIIAMQEQAIDELKIENKTQAKQIDDLNNRVAHLENGGARNFHHPE